MLSVAQESKRSSLKQVLSLMTLLIFSVAGFLIFSMLHSANAQVSPNPACAGEEKSFYVTDSVNCDNFSDMGKDAN